MELTGYTDRWSVRPGEEIGFHVHCASGRYAAQLVRLLHGDENPRGPGFKETAVASPLDGEHDGGPQAIRKGSYGIVDLGGMLAGRDRLTLSVWLWPTLPGPDEQGVMSWHRCVDRHGPRRADDAGRLHRLPAGRRAGSPLDPPARPACLVQDRGHRRCGVGDAHAHRHAGAMVSRTSPDADRVTAPLAAGALAGGSRLLFAAASLDDTADGPAARGVFNGKIARPVIAGADGVLAAWDFHAAAAGTALVDTSGGARHGQTVNRPARLMTGPGWPGKR